MNILITGGAGFIGSNFVRYWAKQYPKDKVIVLDKLTYAGDRNRISDVESSGNVEFVEGDIQDIKLVDSIMHSVQTVVHFAAETHVDRSLAGFEAEQTFYRTNIEGTSVLLHAAHKYSVQRFHHVSTDEVFGDLDFQDTKKFNEEFPYHPNNPYSISKAAADYLVHSFFRTYSLPITVSNCTNNYGPYQTPEKIIPRSISLLLQGEKIPLYTNAEGMPGTNVRDWLHVVDHCRAIEKILISGKIGETYCVGGNAEKSNLQLVNEILDIFSKETGHLVSFENNVELVSDRPGHDRRYAMSAGKLERELQWRPVHTITTGLRETIHWYLSDVGQHWLESLVKTSNDVRIGQSTKRNNVN